MADNPKRCFVISPIGAAGSVARKHADMTLNAIIRQALNENGVTFDVKRADESVEIGMITDHLIMEILDSDLIVADLSFLNENVFYELGIAHSAEKPVIHIARLGTKLPFDNNAYRTVMFDPNDWHSHVDVKKQIADMARNALAPGFVTSNQVTHARGVKKLKASADPEQAIVANLVEGMARLQEDVAILKRKLSPTIEDGGVGKPQVELLDLRSILADLPKLQELKLQELKLQEFMSPDTGKGMIRRP